MSSIAESQRRVHDYGLSRDHQIPSGVVQGSIRSPHREPSEFQRQMSIMGPPMWPTSILQSPRDSSQKVPLSFFLGHSSSVLIVELFRSLRDKFSIILQLP